MPRTGSLPRPSWRSVRKYLPRRWWIWALVAVLVALLGWIGVRGLLAKGELESAQALIVQLRAQVLDFDVEGARGTLEQVAARTDAAASLTGDPLWWACGFIPIVGNNFSAVRELANAAQDVVDEVATPLVEVLDVVSPESLVPVDGAIDLKPFIDAMPVVSRANDGIKAAVVAVDEIRVDGALGAVVTARDTVAGMLDEVAPLLAALDGALPLLPPAMGSDGPRTYLVMFQNSAEARSLGGTALSFAVVNVDNGHIRLERTISASLGSFTQYNNSVIPVPDGAGAVYPGWDFGTFIANATMRPSFATAALITDQMWLNQFGYGVDGVVSVDPVALGYVLRSTGAIPLSTGDILTSDSLVPLLLNDVYQRYNTGDLGEDNRLQDAVYAEAVTATFAALTGGQFDPKALFGAIHQGLAERRVLLWSSHLGEQAALVANGLDGPLPASDEATDRVGVYFQDNVGSKLNYYLHQAVRLSQAVCRADGRQSYRVSVEMTNGLQPGEVATASPSILGHWERERLAPGVQRLVVLLYAPPGSQIVGATVNGAPAGLPPLHDTDYPVGKIFISVAPGTVGHVTFDVVAADPGQKKLEAQITPMVHPTPVTVGSLDCATVVAQ